MERDRGQVLTVYLVAFTCEPGRGSEPGVGWMFLRAAESAARAEGWDLVLVTRSHRIGKIRSALALEGRRQIPILAVPVPKLLWLRGARDVRLASLVWQAKAVRALRRNMARLSGPVLVHHVTFATEGVPSFETLLRDRAALVFGPAGSAAAGADRTVKRRLRSRLARATVQGSDLLVATNSQTAESWRASGTHAAIVTEPNIVVEPIEQQPVKREAVIVGRLIPRKRPDLAIRAIALAEGSPRLGVVGDGPMRADLERLARRLGVVDRVEFLGEVDRETALRALASARVLLHPSMQEGASWVTGEAHAAGVHPIAVRGAGADGSIDLLGLGTVVDEPTPSALARALDAALRTPDRPTPSARWSAERLPALLVDWYGDALAHATRRRDPARG